ncbi:MAG: hypothetical protein P3W90_001900 [Paracoccus sp. (in: a-proteobacteria)]|nr:hypothetical protein [Paracoccus sp. (in: a-proteobacteria)]
MQIAFHLGVHGTDDDQLARCLLQNRSVLAQAGVEAPEPRLYRPVLNEALGALDGATASGSMQDLILDAILDLDSPRRVLLSNRAFLGLPFRAISPDGLYATAPARLAALSGLFPAAEIEFFVALRNPATLIPYIIEAVSGARYDRMFASFSPEVLRWNVAARRILQAAQGRRVVFWCHEDTPLIWPEVLRAVAGVGPEVALTGEQTMANAAMLPQGAQWLRRALETRPPRSVRERREITTEALLQFQNPKATEMELDLSGWTQDYVNHLTALYDADVAEIAALSGAEFILP